MPAAGAPRPARPTSPDTRLRVGVRRPSSSSESAASRRRRRYSAATTRRWRRRYGPDRVAYAPRMDADAIELRVLGCLLEKQRTTPDQYPLTLNALRLACNQTTNRDPIVDYDEREIHDALQRLARRGWTRVASGPGSRAAKYRQLFDQELGLERDATAVLCVLMLRGAQTPGELKQRTERLHRFDDLGDVLGTLDALIGRDLVERLDRRPGRRRSATATSSATRPRTASRRRRPPRHRRPPHRAGASSAGSTRSRQRSSAFARPCARSRHASAEPPQSPGGARLTLTIGGERPAMPPRSRSRAGRETRRHGGGPPRRPSAGTRAPRARA